MKAYLTRMLVAGLVGAAGVAFAARPLIIDDADPLDFRQCKIEAGAWYEKDSGCNDWDWPINLGYGLMRGLEMNLGLGGGQFAERGNNSGGESSNTGSGLDDLTFDVKWQFLGESAWLPRQAIIPAIQFPTANKSSDGMEYDLTWIASKSFCEKMGGHVNVGYTFIGKSPGEEAEDIIHYGGALDYKIIDPLQWVGEVYVENEMLGGTDSVIMFNTGLRWNPVDDLVFDAAAGSRISGDGPDLTATVGLTQTFGFTKKEDK